MKKKKKLGTRITLSIMAVLAYGLISSGLTGIISLKGQSTADMEYAMKERVSSASNLVSATLKHYSTLVASLDGTTAQTEKIMAADSRIVDINTHAETSPGVAVSADGYIVVTGEYANGKACIATSTEWLTDIISSMHTSESTEFYLLSSSGQLLANVNGSLTREQIDPFLGVGKVNTANINGKTRVMYDAQVYGTDWNILVSCDAVEFTGKYNIEVLILILITIISFAGGAFVIHRIVRRIVKPVEAVNTKILGMAHGDLSTPHVDVRTGDELQTLAEAVNTMVDFTESMIGDIGQVAAKLADKDLTAEPHVEYIGDYKPIRTALEGIVECTCTVIKQIEASSKTVAEGSARMSDNSTLLSQSANEQAATVEELNASIVEISSNISANADSAEKAKTISEDSRAIVDEGSAKMADMLRAMEEINETSSKIANIIKAIEDISFQTNILSLNASIEAARAGEAGKGFAVVAGEVGELASKTAEAAKNTTALIKTALSAVENGTVMANETAKMLDKIVSKTDDTAKVIKQIADASRVQSDSVKQILVGMDQISTSVQMNSGSSAECASSAQELSGQAKILLEIVEEFKTPDEAAIKKKQASKRSAERTARNASQTTAKTEKSESEPVAKPEPVKVANPEPKPVVKPEPVNITNSDPKPVVKPEPVKAVKPEPKPVAKPEPAKPVKSEPKSVEFAGMPRSKTIILDDDKY